MKTETAVAILAAGGAQRMGQLKQLLPYQGRPLVRHAVECALGARIGVVVVVLGAHAERVREAFADLPAVPVENQFWETGVASSIKTGINALEVLRAKLTAALIMLADQPLISVDLLRKIVVAYQDGAHPLIATRYADTLGVPALFSRRYFEEIRELPGDTGAKRILERHVTDVHPVDFADAAIDIDTAADYSRLVQTPPEADGR